MAFLPPQYHEARLSFARCEIDQSYFQATRRHAPLSLLAER